MRILGLIVPLLSVSTCLAQPRWRLEVDQAEVTDEKTPRFVKRDSHWEDHAMDPAPHFPMRQVGESAETESLDDAANMQSWDQKATKAAPVRPPKENMRVPVRKSKEQMQAESRAYIRSGNFDTGLPEEMLAFARNEDAREQKLNKRRMQFEQDLAENQAKSGQRGRFDAKAPDHDHGNHPPVKPGRGQRVTDDSESMGAQDDIWKAPDHDHGNHGPPKPGRGQRNTDDAASLKAQDNILKAPDHDHSPPKPRGQRAAPAPADDTDSLNGFDDTWKSPEQANIGNIFKAPDHDHSPPKPRGQRAAVDESDSLNGQDDIWKAPAATQTKFKGLGPFEEKVQFVDYQKDINQVRKRRTQEIANDYENNKQPIFEGKQNRQNNEEKAANKQRREEQFAAKMEGLNKMSSNLKEDLAAKQDFLFEDARSGKKKTSNREKQYADKFEGISRMTGNIRHEAEQDPSRRALKDSMDAETSDHLAEQFAQAVEKTKKFLATPIPEQFTDIKSRRAEKAPVLGEVKELKIPRKLQSDEGEREWTPEFREWRDNADFTAPKKMESFERTRPGAFADRAEKMSAEEGSKKQHSRLRTADAR